MEMYIEITLSLKNSFKIFFCDVLLWTRQEG